MRDGEKMGTSMVAKACARAEAVRAGLLAAPPTRSLRRRRWIARLSAVALANASIIALRQVGAIRRLPDLSGRAFQANAVVTSRPAFVSGVPDGALATALYSLNLIAASAGGSRRTARSRIWSLVLAGNAVSRALGTAAYLWQMLVRQKRLCLSMFMQFSVLG